MSGGLDVFNMLTGGQSPKEAMAAQIQNIQKVIGDLSNNMNYRFDRVDQSLTTIFNTMNQRFGQIEFMLNGQNQLIAQLQGSVYDIRTSLVGVQASLDRIEAENFASFSAAQQDQTVGPIDNDLIYSRYPTTRGPLPEVGYGSSGGGYEADEGLFYKYAVNDANNYLSSPSNSLDLSSSGLAQQLAARPLDANLNYIQQFLTSTLKVNTVGTPNSPVLPNPQEWFIAAYAYLQLAGENPMYFRKDAPKREVSDIISRGQNDASFCTNLTFNGANINWGLYTALENYYITNLLAFDGQVSAFEDNYATATNFALDTWRQWDVAAPRVRATASLDSAATTEVMVSPAMSLSPIPRHTTSIAAGYSHSLALKTDGTILDWGDNSYGQTTLPASATNVVAIAAGFYHSLALKDDGTVVGWGFNLDGEVTGVPNTTYPFVSAGLVKLAGQTLTNVVAVAAGDFYSLALKADGTIVGWGDNSYGQTNVPAGLTNVVAIAAGSSHSLALKADGTVVGWGLNDYGQATGVPNTVSPYLSLGPVSVAGQTLTNVVAIAAGSFHSLALRADGTAVGWGDNYFGQTIVPTAATNLVAIAAGEDHSLFLKVTATTSPGGGANSFLVLAQIPVRVRALLQGCNQNMLAELALTGSALDNTAANLSGAKALLAAVLELGMPYTLERDSVLHGFLYGSESLVDTGAAIDFLNAQDAQLQVMTTNTPPQALTKVAALRYLRFQDRLNQCLTNLQATGQPEIPRLLGHTLRLLNLLNDAWVTPTNSPPPALETLMVSNQPSLLLYGGPYVNYTLQSCDTLTTPNWTNTPITGCLDGQTNAMPFSSDPQRFYRAVTVVPPMQ